jgi:hypothetical protein
MPSDPEHVNDEEITTVRGQEPAASGFPEEADTGDATDQADARDATDQAGAVAASGGIDTGAMMDSRDTGTLDRTDVGEREESDADESDQ